MHVWISWVLFFICQLRTGASGLKGTQVYPARYGRTLAIKQRKLIMRAFEVWVSGFRFAISKGMFQHRTPPAPIVPILKIWYHSSKYICIIILRITLFWNIPLYLSLQMWEYGARPKIYGHEAGIIDWPLRDAIKNKDFSDPKTVLKALVGWFVHSHSWLVIIVDPGTFLGGIVCSYSSGAYHESNLSPTVQNVSIAIA